MIIESIVPKLYQVKEVIPQEYVDQLHELDWLSLPNEVPPKQENMIRKKILDDNVPLLGKVNKLLENYAWEIGDLLGLEFDSIRTLWWLDLPGFTSGIHIDSTDCPAMQVYWLAPSTNYGTSFYKNGSFNPTPETTIKNFEFIPNTGYINDLTGPDSEKIFHGMLIKVPEDTYRVSSYTQYMVAQGD